MEKNLGCINHVLLTEVNAESQPLALYPQSEAISRPSPKSYRHHLICAGASPSCSAHRGASLRCLVHAAMPLECAAHCVPHSLSDEEPAPLRCGPGASPSISHTRFLAPVGLCLPVKDVRVWEPFFPTICIIAMKLNKL